MVLNMESVGGLPKARGLIEIPQEPPEIGVVHYSLLVALHEESVTNYQLTSIACITSSERTSPPNLEVSDIDTVKSSQGGVEPDISQSDLRASKVTLTGEDTLHSVQSCK